MPQIRVFKGRHVAVHKQVPVEADRAHLAHRLGHLVLHVPEQRESGGCVSDQCVGIVRELFIVTLPKERWKRVHLIHKIH
jgi:hypothetical protein